MYTGTMVVYFQWKNIPPLSKCVKLALTVPPSQVNTGLLLPPLVTRETRRVCRSPLGTDVSSAFGARPLHMTWKHTKKCDIGQWPQRYAAALPVTLNRTKRKMNEWTCLLFKKKNGFVPVPLGRPVVWGWTCSSSPWWSPLYISLSEPWKRRDQVV